MYVLLTVLADNDDDGETAAGGRLAHLLQILVCVLLVIIRHTESLFRRLTMSLSS